MPRPVPTGPPGLLRPPGPRVDRVWVAVGQGQAMDAEGFPFLRCPRVRSNAAFCPFPCHVGWGKGARAHPCGACPPHNQTTRGRDKTRGRASPARRNTSCTASVPPAAARIVHLMRTRAGGKGLKKRAKFSAHSLTPPDPKAGPASGVERGREGKGGGGLPSNRNETQVTRWFVLFEERRRRQRLLPRSARKKRRGVVRSSACRAAELRLGLSGADGGEQGRVSICMW